MPSFLRDSGINATIKWHLSLVRCNNTGYDLKCLIYVLSEYFIVRKMNRSSKMSVTGVSKSGNPRSGKGRKVHMPNVIKTKTTQQ